MSKHNFPFYNQMISRLETHHCITCDKEDIHGYYDRKEKRYIYGYCSKKCKNNDPHNKFNERLNKLALNRGKTREITKSIPKSIKEVIYKIIENEEQYRILCEKFKYYSRDCPYFTNEWKGCTHPKNSRGCYKDNCPETKTIKNNTERPKLHSKKLKRNCLVSSVGVKKEIYSTDKECVEAGDICSSPALFEG
jgi:hypothetical protein